MSAYYTLLNRQHLDNGNILSHFKSQIHAQGAWNDHEQHMAPATGIMAHELEYFAAQHLAPQLRFGRISLDILGLIHAGEFEIETRIIRSGKTIELIEAEMHAQGRSCIVARAWRMLTTDTSAIAGLEDTPLSQHPEMLPEWQGMNWNGGYIRSVRLHADERRDGKGIVWITNDLNMVDGEPVSDFVKIMGMIDTANGIVPRQGLPVQNWAFPNLDLQIHLHRLPQGSWLGLQTVQQYGSDGIGLTSSVLHDLYGPFGRSEQILTLRPMAE